MNAYKAIAVHACLFFSFQNYTTPFDFQDYAAYMAGSTTIGAGLGWLVNDIKNSGEGTDNTSNPEKAVQVGAILGAVAGTVAALTLWLGCAGDGSTKMAKLYMATASMAAVIGGLFYCDLKIPDSTAGKQNEWWHLVLNGAAGGLGATAGGALAAALCHAGLVRFGYRAAA